MSFIVVIPARLHSTRLPAKPLADIGGAPMIERVYRQACLSAAERVLVATDDERIAQVVRGFGGEVCMTSVNHTSGTDRLQEVAAHLALADDAIVVNVQGDEPLIPPAVINQVAANLAVHQAASVASLCEPLASDEDFHNPNIVKVVTDQQGFALYFSRAPIPWPRDNPTGASSGAEFIARRHIGLYAYRVSLLNLFVRWPVAALEQMESLEQLRVLAAGHKIHLAEAVEMVPGGVDTAADLARIQALWRQRG
ncbi:MAG TPA: 3-deoxy-manno-octulosonate cytidylyltransferase [Cellvibrionaceae bacterium]